MFFSYFVLFVALGISAIAAWYSIIGLTAIFAAAVMPIIIMGAALEIAKITATVWLHKYWHRCRWLMKLYLVHAVVILMIITSMGIFGFLSKAHVDQNIVSGDVQSKISLYDEKIRTERENIDANRRALKQLDEAVDQVMGRSTDERGAERSVQIRRAQQRERGRLLAEIGESQKKIAALNEERAPIAAEFRKVEAEVGPIKYIAALVYGDNPDTNLLERAVRWVIILLVVVFDPLAIMLVLAASESIKWHREQQIAVVNEPEYEPDDGALTDEQIQQIQETAPDPPPYQTEPFLHVDPLQPAVPPDTAPLINEVLADRDEFFEESPMEDQEDSLEGKRIADTTYGHLFPENPKKGDLHVRTDHVPTRLYKYIGTRWIEIYKNTTDSYVYNNAYIDFLIENIEQGFYDPELLTDSEREQIATRLGSANDTTTS